MICKDKNGTPLNVGDCVMHISNGKEYEATVVEVVSENKVNIDGERGIITVNASDCFYLP